MTSLRRLAKLERNISDFHSETGLRLEVVNGFRDEVGRVILGGGWRYSIADHDDYLNFCRPLGFTIWS